MERQKLNSMHHMVAGSIAGVAEHAAVFPIDTIKTHVQAASAEEMAANGTRHRKEHCEAIRRGAFIAWVIGAAADGPRTLMFSGYERVLQLAARMKPAPPLSASRSLRVSRVLSARYCAVRAWCPLRRSSNGYSLATIVTRSTAFRRCLRLAAPPSFAPYPQHSR